MNHASERGRSFLVWLKWQVWLKWKIYSKNIIHVSIGSDDGLLLIRQQAIFQISIDTALRCTTHVRYQRVKMVKGDPRLDDRPGVRWPAIYSWHFLHQLKSPSWAPKFTNKIFSITCVFILLYSEGTGAEMDSIHIYFETRVLSVSHTMIDNVPNFSNCVIFTAPLSWESNKMKTVLISSVLDDGCCLTASSHYPCWY